MFTELGDAKLVIGVYDHYKGGTYYATGLATFADTGGPVVVYKSLDYRTLHVRRWEEWNELVRWPDGEARRRFVSRGLRGAVPSFKVPRSLCASALRLDPPTRATITAGGTFRPCRCTPLTPEDGCLIHTWEPSAAWAAVDLDALRAHRILGGRCPRCGSADHQDPETE